MEFSNIVMIHSETSITELGVVGVMEGGLEPISHLLNSLLSHLYATSRGTIV